MAFVTNLNLVMIISLTADDLVRMIEIQPISRGQGYIWNH